MESRGFRTLFPHPVNPGHPERLEIIGARGAASLIGDRLRVALIDGAEEVTEAEGATDSGANIMDCPIDAHRALLGDFFRCCT